MTRSSCCVSCAGSVMTWTPQRIETAEELRSALASHDWDLVLCDYSLPHLDPPQALEIIKSAGLDLPFIIVSGTIGEESAISALKAGAHDFIIKGKYARLGPAIERELGEALVRRQRRQAEMELREKEQLLSEAQRIGHIGSWSYDIPTGSLQFSDEMYRLLDILPQNFDHSIDAFLGLIYPEDQPPAEAWVRPAQGRQAGQGAGYSPPAQGWRASLPPVPGCDLLRRDRPSQPFCGYGAGYFRAQAVRAADPPAARPADGPEDHRPGHHLQL